MEPHDRSVALEEQIFKEVSRLKSSDHFRDVDEAELVYAPFHLSPPPPNLQPVVVLGQAFWASPERWLNLASIAPIQSPLSPEAAPSGEVPAFRDLEAIVRKLVGAGPELYQGIWTTWRARIDGEWRGRLAAEGYEFVSGLDTDASATVDGLLGLASRTRWLTLRPLETLRPELPDTCDYLSAPQAIESQLGIYWDAWVRERQRDWAQWLRDTEIGSVARLRQLGRYQQLGPDREALQEIMALSVEEPDWHSVAQIFLAVSDDVWLVADPDTIRSINDIRDDLAKRTALSALRNRDIRLRVCAALKIAGDDAMEVAKLIIPFVLGLSAGGAALGIPVLPLVIASIAIIAARMGAAALCAGTEASANA